jgi:hypothetical protein
VQRRRRAELSLWPLRRTRRHRHGNAVAVSAAAWRVITAGEIERAENPEREASLHLHYPDGGTEKKLVRQGRKCCPVRPLPDCGRVVSNGRRGGFAQADGTALMRHGFGSARIVIQAPHRHLGSRRRSGWTVAAASTRPRTMSWFPILIPALADCNAASMRPRTMSWFPISIPVLADCNVSHINYAKSLTTNSLSLRTSAAPLSSTP